MLTFLELTPRFKKLKRRASLEFCIHLATSNSYSNLNGLQYLILEACFII